MTENHGWITCQIMGGLGNQLFQIATVEAAARQTGRTAFYLKISNSPSVFEPRPVYWDTLFKDLNIRNDLPSTDISEIKESSYRYDDQLINRIKENQHDVVVLSGYFQSYKYFEPRDIAKIVSKTDLMLQDNILETVAVHIRVGDYAQLSGNILTHLWKLPYYEKACRHIQSHNPYMHDNYQIFTDHTAYTLEDLTRLLGVPEEYITMFSGAKKDYPQDAFELIYMSYFRHFITANSSFSWWAAYIAYFYRGRKGHVVCPQEWFGSGARGECVDDLIPPEWEKI